MTATECYRGRLKGESSWEERNAAELGLGEAVVSEWPSPFITPDGAEAFTAKLPTSPKFFWEEEVLRKLFGFDIFF